MPDAPIEPPNGEPHSPGMEARVRSLEIDVSVLKQIASSTQTMLERMDHRFEQLEGRLDRMEGRLDRLEDRMWSNFLWLLGTGIAGLGALFAPMGHGFLLVVRLTGTPRAAGDNAI